MTKKERSTRRGRIQLAAAVFFNGYILGFQKGKIFTGKSKSFCVPVLNCYSCPGALGACPIGSLQSIAAGQHYRISFYVLGTLMLFGLLLGRAICGFLCPFGWIQDLLYRIPCKKPAVPRKPDRILRRLKYGVLVFLVLLLPAVLRDSYGFGTTWFCKYLCPAGTLEAGVPLLLKNEGLRQAAGALFRWKFAVLLLILFLSAAISRPFCKYLCPLGAFYGLFNRFSLYRLTVDETQCSHCGACVQACRMGVEITKEINSSECIRCGVCMEACPGKCIHRSWGKST